MIWRSIAKHSYKGDTFPGVSASECPLMGAYLTRLLMASIRLCKRFKPSRAYVPHRTVCKLVAKVDIKEGMNILIEGGARTCQEEARLSA